MTAPIGLPPPVGSLLPPQETVAARPRVGAGQGIDRPNAVNPAPEPGVTPFTEHLEHIIQEVDGAQRTAEQKATDFAEHRSNDLHGTMISLSKADIQLRFVSSIRNKVIEAYREVMRMGA